MNQRAMIPADNDTADLLEEAARYLHGASTSQYCTNLINRLQRRAYVLRHPEPTTAAEAAVFQSGYGRQ